jgi:hypothetical protein
MVEETDRLLEVLRLSLEEKRQSRSPVTSKPCVASPAHPARGSAGLLLAAYNLGAAAGCKAESFVAPPSYCPSSNRRTSSRGSVVDTRSLKLLPDRDTRDPEVRVVGSQYPWAQVDPTRGLQI